MHQWLGKKVRARCKIEWHAGSSGRAFVVCSSALQHPKFVPQQILSMRTLCVCVTPAKLFLESLPIKDAPDIHNKNGNL